MIISKDLFIFGEQIFATILPAESVSTTATAAAAATATTTGSSPLPVASLKLQQQHIQKLKSQEDNDFEEYSLHLLKVQQQQQLLVDPLKTGINTAINKTESKAIKTPTTKGATVAVIETAVAPQQETSIKIEEVLTEEKSNKTNSSGFGEEEGEHQTKPDSKDIPLVLPNKHSIKSTEKVNEIEEEDKASEADAVVHQDKVIEEAEVFTPSAGVGVIERGESNNINIVAKAIPFSEQRDDEEVTRLDGLQEKREQSLSDYFESEPLVQGNNKRKIQIIKAKTSSTNTIPTATLKKFANFAVQHRNIKQRDEDQQSQSAGKVKGQHCGDSDSDAITTTTAFREGGGQARGSSVVFSNFESDLLLNCESNSIVNQSISNSNSMEALKGKVSNLMDKVKLNGSESKSCCYEASATLDEHNSGKDDIGVGGGSSSSSSTSKSAGDVSIDIDDVVNVNLNARHAEPDVLTSIGFVGEPQDHQHHTMQLTFQNVNVFHNGRKILNDVSGLVSPGEILAIMGPSGCGKTTLLDCLSGQRRIDSGSIYLNREPISKKWRRKICYVLQEEVFFSGLTLRETVMYTALLRLPEKMSKSEKVKVVDRILETLELDCCQHTKFGDYLNRGLSGGEKKRANIACELLTNPLLMLLDEPTSGLDSHSAISLMKVLKRYAEQEQKTVVITVHQPSSQMFHMFDKLLLLYNGRTAYFGDVKNIYSYFEDIGVSIKPHYNPADFVLEQIKSYPEIREKLFIAAKESQGNLLNRNCLTMEQTQQLLNCHQHLQHHHHYNHHHHQPNMNQNQSQNQNVRMMATMGNSSSGNDGDGVKDKYHEHDTLINDILHNYYKDLSGSNYHHHNHNDNDHDHNNHVDKNNLLNQQKHGLHGNHQKQKCNHHVLIDHHLHHHHKEEVTPMLIGAKQLNASSIDEEASQQLWCPTADSQSSFSSNSSDCQHHHHHECYLDSSHDWLDYPTRFHTQFRVLLSRNFKEAKPLMLSKLNWFQTIGLALMAGAIWFQLPRTEEYLHDMQGWMFFSQTYWMLFALFGALNSFPAEREVISKERRSGAYRLSAYYLAKMWGELPLVVTLPTVYLIISYPMLGCSSVQLFILMLVFLLLNTIVAQSVGFFIGACCMDMNVSITLSALYTLATQLFGGYLSSRIPEGLGWIRYTSMIHYAYQNMQILEFSKGPAISCGNPSSFEICKNHTTTFIPYEEILKAQNSTSPLWLNTFVLLMFFLVFRLLGYAVLRYIRCPKTS